MLLLVFCVCIYLVMCLLSCLMGNIGRTDCILVCSYVCNSTVLRRCFACTCLYMVWICIDVVSYVVGNLYSVLLCVCMFVLICICVVLQLCMFVLSCICGVFYVCVFSAFLNEEELGQGGHKLYTDGL